jgi:DNA repair exonuclease SbcCD ATPase subunit
VVGKNGDGKSTMLDALTFVLFGEPFRQVKKNQLINSINGKNAEVEIEFSSGTNTYKIRRGIKPNIFEYYENGVLQNQSAAISDCQKKIEEQILKINYRTFCQVCILGSASYIPFMQLPTNQRRLVIEDILDIGIFSKMNDILKIRAVDTKLALVDVNKDIEIAKSNIQAQKTILENLSVSKQENIIKIDEKIEKYREDIKEIQNKISILNKRLLEIDNLTTDSVDVFDRVDKARKLIAINESRIAEIQEKIMFFNENENCPTCESVIQHKQHALSKLEKEKEDIKSRLSKLLEALTSGETRAREIRTLFNEKLEINNEISNLNTSVKFTETNIENSINEKQELSDATRDTSKYKDKIKELAEHALVNVDKKNNLMQVIELENTSKLLLQDSGVKTAIIRKYLPVMNKLINKYLQAMDFYVHFELDENFNETIRSRHRDEFTYDSFSEGEKMRIDLAILFTWRHIAKMKNSINTSLLVLDEIFDSSLDASGVDYFLNLISQLDAQVNVFVISHKGDTLIEKFMSTIKFEKKNDFSTIVNA